jgi:hypothetical protein
MKIKNRRLIRNLKPHKEAVAAMELFMFRYATSGLGSMDFFDSLYLDEKKRCADLVTAMRKATGRWNSKKDAKPNNNLI